MKKRIVLIVLIAVVFVSLGCSYLYISFYNIGGPTPTQGQERAEALLAALEQHRQGTGTYPEKLRDLVPDYLSAVPRAAWRYPYRYETDARRTEYVIFFTQGNDTDNICGYSSRTDE